MSKDTKITVVVVAVYVAVAALGILACDIGYGVIGFF